MNSNLEERIWACLDEVLDPCSTFTERPQSVVDLGLIDSVRVEDGGVEIHLLPTNQLCMYIPHMSNEIETRLRELESVVSVRVEIVADEVWTQDRMTAAAKREREEHFQSRVEANDLTPAYDGDSWSAEIQAELAGGTDGG